MVIPPWVLVQPSMICKAETLSARDFALAEGRDKDMAAGYRLEDLMPVYNSLSWKSPLLAVLPG